MNKYLCIACIVLAVIVAALGGVINSLRNEKNRLAGNQEALMEDIRFYQDEAGRQAASVQSLELTKAELEAHNEEMVQVIRDLNVKLRRVEAAAKAATETKIEVQTVIKDSVVVRDSFRLERLPAIKWQDPWVKVEGLINRDSTVSLSIHSVDTLYQVVHRVPNEWWFFKWGTKAIRQEITSSNPHTKIVYSEYIELKRCGRNRKK